MTSYHPTAEGLKNQIGELIDAVTLGELRKAKSLVEATVMTDPGPIFAALFGAERTPALTEDYLHRFGRAPSRLLQLLLAVTSSGNSFEICTGVASSPLEEAGSLWVDRGLRALRTSESLGWVALVGYGPPVFLDPWVHTGGLWRQLGRLTPLCRDEPEGLKELAGDALEAAMLRDEAELERLFSSMTLPDVEGWARATFGPEMEPLATRGLSPLMTSLLGRLRDDFLDAAREGCDEVEVIPVWHPYDPAAPFELRAALFAMQRRDTLCLLRFVRRGQPNGEPFGAFTHDGSAWRYVGSLSWVGEQREEAERLARPLAEAMDETLQYPASPEGLRHLLSSLLHLAGMDLGYPFDTLLARLDWPGRDSWCDEEFGPALAARTRPGAPRDLEVQLRSLARHGLWEVSAWEVMGDLPYTGTTLQHVALSLSRRGLRLFNVEFADPTAREPATRFLSFVHVEGAFRWLGELRGLTATQQAMQLLSAEADRFALLPEEPPTEGLARLLEELRRVVLRRDDLLLEVLLGSFQLADASAWFGGILADEARAEAATRAYQEDFRVRATVLARVLSEAPSTSRLEVVVVPDPGSTGAPFTFAVPAPVVAVRVMDKGRTLSTLFPFVLVEGRWRLLGGEVDRAGTLAEDWLRLLLSPRR